MQSKGVFVSRSVQFVYEQKKKAGGRDVYVSGPLPRYANPSVLLGTLGKKDLASWWSVDKSALGPASVR